MNIKPILFNTDMVRAILANEKTQTRRIVKPNYKDDEYCLRVVTNQHTGEKYLEKLDEDEEPFPKPRFVFSPYEIGDILWVRETWSTTDKCGLYPNWLIDGIHYMYKADDPDCSAAKEARWYPSIHMPKQAARIFLRVKEVRVERLQSITSYGCVKEGISKDILYALKERMTKGIFATLWESTIKKADLPKYGWDANPLVWVIEFERCEKPEGWGAE